MAGRWVGWAGTVGLWQRLAGEVGGEEGARRGGQLSAQGFPPMLFGITWQWIDVPVSAGYLEQKRVWGVKIAGGHQHGEWGTTFCPFSFATPAQSVSSSSFSLCPPFAVAKTP